MGVNLGMKVEVRTNTRAGYQPPANLAGIDMGSVRINNVNRMGKAAVEEIWAELDSLEDIEPTSSHGQRYHFMGELQDKSVEKAPMDSVQLKAWAFGTSNISEGDRWLGIKKIHAAINAGETVSNKMPDSISDFMMSTTWGPRWEELSPAEQRDLISNVHIRFLCYRSPIIDIERDLFSNDVFARMARKRVLENTRVRDEIFYGSDVKEGALARALVRARDKLFYGRDARESVLT
ncbi:hypothetical protein ACFLZ2_04395 [Candidatus Margulisiibacteriota bacterium]